MYLTPLHFFFNDTATTEIYTLSLHDALPIYPYEPRADGASPPHWSALLSSARSWVDRKSTRLNSSHVSISYAVFCLKKKTLCPHRYAVHPRHSPEPQFSAFLVFRCRRLLKHC